MKKFHLNRVGTCRLGIKIALTTPEWLDISENNAGPEYLNHWVPAGCLEGQLENTTRLGGNKAQPIRSYITY